MATPKKKTTTVEIEWRYVTDSTFELAPNEYIVGAERCVSSSGEASYVAVAKEQ